MSSETCGWCCTVAGTTWGSLRVFPALISLILGAVLLFILVKIGVNYLRLHRERQTQKLLGKSGLYHTFPRHGHLSSPSINSGHSSPPPLDSSALLSAAASETEDENDLRRPLADFSSSEVQLRDETGEAVPTVYHLQHLSHLFTPRKPVPLRWFHFLYLIATSGWFLLQALVLLTSSGTPLVRMIDILLYEGHATIDLTIIMITFFPNDAIRNMGIALGMTVVVVAVSSATALFYSLDGDCATCSFFFPAPEAFYTYLIYGAFYSCCLILLYVRLPRTVPRPRRSVAVWVIFLLSVYAGAIVGAALVNFGGYDIGYCIMDVVIMWYCLPYGPLLYWTVCRDSDALSRILEPPLEVPSYTVSPLVARAHKLVQKHSVGWIPFEEIIIGERIGYGSAGEVYKGFFLQTPVAIKRLMDNKSQTQALEEFFREVTLMSKLSHPNVLLFMGVCVRDNGDRYIITEMMNKGSVFDLLHPNLSYSTSRRVSSKNRINADRIYQILMQSARAMSYLHSFDPPILHRDLKSHNLLVDDHWNVKVADFGLSRAQSTNTMSAAGTPQWSAPEVIREERYTTKADVFSFGVIIYELISRKVPYANMGPLTAARQVAYENLRPRFPDGCDPAYIELAEKCWDMEAQVRPTFPQIVSILSAMNPPVLLKDYHTR